ncbi:MAG: TIGR03663 family protein [Chloroflexi bacterium]|nr:TIGR03663 family protein [Chloroflexota bacterium]
MTTTPTPSERSFLDSPALLTLRLNWEKIAWIALLLVAFLLRVYDVGARTMSHDESLHTTYSYNLYNGTGFQHDPLMHGPLLFHFTAASYFIFGPSDFSARFPVVLLGVGVVALMWFVRPWLGKIGAFLAAALMTFSPTLIFHSRYIRHDLYAIFFAVAVIILLFRYLQEGREKLLLWMAVALGFLYTTKEVSYIYVIIISGFFVVWVAMRLLRERWENNGLRWPFFGLLALGAILAVYPMNEALKAPAGQLVVSQRLGGMVMWPMLLLGFALVFAALFLLWRGYGGERLRAIREMDVLVWLITLSAPLFAAFPIKIFGGTPDNVNITGNILQQPTVLLAAAVFFSMLIIFTWLGFFWSRERYLVALGLYYAVMLLFFTTFFTNGNGVATGLIGSMGYWLAQQEVARGGQPWFYYFMLVPLYEFLPLLLSLLGAIVVLWRALRGRPVDPTGDDEAAAPAFRAEWLLFLIWWTALTWAAYTWAGEKMPWLATHFAVPMSILGGWYLAERLKLIDWARARALGGWWFVLGLPLWLLTLIAFLRLRPFGGSDLNSLSQTMAWIASLALLVGLGYALVRKGLQLGGDLSRRLAFLSLMLILTIMSLRTALLYNYVNYDYAIEPMVYAHGTPDIKIVVDELHEISRRTVGEGQLAFAYDNETTWPFEWYFRDFPNKKFFGGSPSREYLKDAPVVLVGTENEDKVRPFLGKDYYRIVYRQIWWPKETYKQLIDGAVQPDGSVLKGLPLLVKWLTTPEDRQALIDVILYRRYKQPLADWDPSDRFIMFIRKDIAAQVWNLGAAPAPIAETLVDPFAGKEMLQPATQIIGGVAGPGAGQLQQPRNMAVGPDGRIYVADSGNHRIQVFNPDGSYALDWGGFGAEPGQFNEPWGIAVSEDGRVYVADTWNHRIQVFDSEGNFITQWGAFVSTDGQLGEMGVFWGPRAVAFDNEGNLLVTDTGNKRVQVFDPDGVPITQFGGAGVDTGFFDEPVGLAVGPDGSIYVADTWNQRVQKFNAQYQFVKEWPVPGWESEGIFDKPYIAVDENNVVYASDPTSWRILVWDSEGVAKAALGQYGAGLTDFALPNGVSIAPDGSLWVADADNNRIMRFEPIR